MLAIGFVATGLLPLVTGGHPPEMYSMAYMLILGYWVRR
jgi:hypothetical protein